VAMNCKKTSTAKASIPSASETLFERRTVANVDPKAIVITRSNAFIFERVRLPETRSKKTSPI